jgi:acetoin utilization deacetylase AcuC-like enzyme
LQGRDRIVATFAREQNIPLVVTLGGGYSVPVELTAEAHANTFRMAAQIFA